METRSITSSSSTAGMPQQRLSPGRPETPTSAPLARSGDLPARNVPAASQTVASLPPRTALPAAPIESSPTGFLEAVHAATLLDQRDQRAVVTQFLQLPDDQLKAIINSQDENGNSALHKLAQSVSLDYKLRSEIPNDAADLLRPLLEKGADPRLVNHEGKTAAQYVGGRTRVSLVARVGYEMAHSGPLNRQRLEYNHAAYATDPAKAQALAEVRQDARETFRAVGGMFNKGLNRLKPYVLDDVVRYASHQPTPSLANSARFFGPAEHAQYSLFDANGRVSAHVAHGLEGVGRREENNLVLRFEPGDAGRPVLKGIVFPSWLKGEDGRKQYQPHTTALGGGPFAFAGEISADTDGRITSLSNKSGHNRPRPILVAAMTLYLKSQGLLAEDFTMAVASHPSDVEYKGSAAFAKAREMIEHRWPEITVEARAGLGQKVAGLEDRLRDSDAAAGLEHGPGRSALSRQQAQAYAELKLAQADAQFFRLIGYDPLDKSVDPRAAPPPGSYRQAEPEGPGSLATKHGQPEAAHKI